MSTITKGHHAISFRKVDLALIGLTPAIMVLLAWDFGSEMSSYRGFMRGNSFPVTIVQLIYAMIAIRQGFSPVASLFQLPALTKFGLLLLHVIMFWTAVAVAPSGLIALFGIFAIYVHVLFWLACNHEAKRWSADDCRNIWRAIGLGIVAYALLWLINIIAYNPQGEDWMWLVPAVTNIRWIGFFALAGFCGGVGALVLTERKLLAREHLVLPFLFMTLGCFLATWTGSRGSMLAIVIASAFSIFVSRDRKTLAGIIMLAAIVAIAITATLPVVHPAYGLGRILGSATHSQDLNDLSSNRIEIWITTVERIMAHPWFGWGIDQYRLSWPEGEVGVRNPHQSVLQLLFATGAAGALALVMIVIPFISRIPTRYPEPGHWAAGAFFISGTIYGLYDGFFYYAYPTMIYLASVAMLIRPIALPSASDRSDLPAQTEADRATK
jgi:hypothetical protein